MIGRLAPEWRSCDSFSIGRFEMLCDLGWCFGRRHMQYCGKPLTMGKSRLVLAKQIGVEAFVGSGVTRAYTRVSLGSCCVFSLSWRSEDTPKKYPSWASATTPGAYASVFLSTDSKAEARYGLAAAKFGFATKLIASQRVLVGFFLTAGEGAGFRQRLGETPRCRFRSSCCRIHRSRSASTRCRCVHLKFP